MFSNRKFSICCAAVTAAVFLLSFLVPAALSDTASGRIRNFGRVNQNLYRGGRPKAGDYEYLASLGIKCIVDLERGGEADEKKLVESAGMRFYGIPMSDTCEPTKEQVAEFLKIVSDPKNQPLYLHCRAGRHRTGAMTAIYRIVHDGWTADRAYAEMKQYQFKRGTGHGALKKCVYEYSTSTSREKN
jgi:protein tyrosine/serine phosphatase